MLVKVAPMGGQVVEVNVEQGTAINEILHNDRAITLNSAPASLITAVTSEMSIVSLANKMKGGR
jgi:hypothetical protein